MKKIMLCVAAVALTLVAGAASAQTYVQADAGFATENGHSSAATFDVVAGHQFGAFTVEGDYMQIGKLQGPSEPANHWNWRNRPSVGSPTMDFGVVNISYTLPVSYYGVTPYVTAGGAANRIYSGKNTVTAPTNVVLDLGAGANYNITSKLAVGVQYRYYVSNEFDTTASLSYHLSKHFSLVAQNYYFDANDANIAERYRPEAHYKVDTTTLGVRYTF